MAPAKDAWEDTGDAEKGATHGAATEGKQPTPQTAREGGPNAKTEARNETTGEPPRVPTAAWKQLRLPTVCGEALVQQWHDGPKTGDKTMG